MGLSPTEAVNMMMHYLAMYKELPFQPRIPNDQTLEAFQEVDKNRPFTAYKNTDALMKDLLSDAAENND
jgi:addiction module RelB/DinJ family antitoxin